jgi:uncharacterized alkaline shock family protein YloU
MNEENKIGNVKIADDVVSVIARIAADEIDGITGMTTSFTSGFKDIVSGKTASKGIKAQIDENEVTVDAYIKVKYGVNIPEVARKVQKNIKQSIENMTGLNVVSVNIFVQSVSFVVEESLEAK